MAVSTMIHWPSKHELFGVNVSATEYGECVEILSEAARRRQGVTVTHMAVHALITAARDASFRGMLNEFDIVAPDGQPVRYALDRLYGTGLPDRVYGPELMRRLCAHAAETGIGVYLYGSRREVVESLKANLEAAYPGLRVVGCEPSVFRPLTEEEDQALVKRINDSGAGFVFVGLGCPRQEIFAYEHRHSIQAVQLCVGAAFDFHAGNKRMAPTWMQKRGLEWLFRLSQEPGRLWKRYLTTNSVFCWLFAKRLLLGR